MNMIGSVIGALVVGLISVFAIVISQGIVSGQDTSGWPTVLTSIVTNIAPVIGIVGGHRVMPTLNLANSVKAYSS
jgi:hypothetical protein